MKRDFSPKTTSEKKRPTKAKPMDTTETYQVEGRTFVVQPVFRESGDMTLASLLLNLMQADAAPE